MVASTSSPVSNKAIIDWNFLKSKPIEGYKDYVYVPSVGKGAKVHPVGGATTGMGVDIGTMNAWDVKRLHLRKELADKLTPYLDRKGAKAVVALTAEASRQEHSAKRSKDTGWNYVADKGHEASALSSEDILELSIARGNLEVSQIQKFYNPAVGKSGGKYFELLPTRIQTTMVSVSWHNGQIWLDKNKAHEIWKAAVAQQWDRFMEELLKLGEKEYKSRREAEVMYMLGAYDGAITDQTPRLKKLHKAMLEKMPKGGSEGGTSVSPKASPPSAPSSSGIPLRLG